MMCVMVQIVVKALAFEKPQKRNIKISIFDIITHHVGVGDFLIAQLLYIVTQIMNL